MGARTRLAGVVAVAAFLAACGGSGQPTVATGTATSPGAGVVPSGVACPDVAIGPQSSDMATGIRVTGASCDQATALAKAAPRDGSQFMSGGFGCEASGHSYRCMMGNLLVTFTRH